MIRQNNDTGYVLNLDGPKAMRLSFWALRLIYVANLITIKMKLWQTYRRVTTIICWKPSKNTSGLLLL